MFWPRSFAILKSYYVDTLSQYHLTPSVTGVCSKLVNYDKLISILAGKFGQVFLMGL